MAANISQWNSVVTKAWLFYGSILSGYVQGVATSALANAADDGMERLKGFVSDTLTIPEGGVIPVPADGGIASSYRQLPQTSVTGALVGTELKEAFINLMAGTKLYTQQQHDEIIDSIKCLEFKDMFFVLNVPAKSQESATLNQQGWEVTEYFLVQGQETGNARANGAVTNVNFALLMDEVDTTPYGESITDANFGVTQGYRKRYWSPYPVYYHTYIGDGNVSQTFDLDYAPVTADGDALIIWQNGTKLTYTTNYTVSSTTVSFVTDPAAASYNVCRVQFDGGVC